MRNGGSTGSSVALYADGAQGSARDVGNGSGAVVFAGSDGTIADSSCGFAECADATSQAAYDDVRHYPQHMTPPIAGNP